MDNEFFYIVMEYCNGGELFEHIMDRGKFSERQAARVVRRVVGALKHLHDLKICHRDLKPENLIFDKSSNDVRLIDFGLSKIANHEEELETKVGTPYYVAPEVLKGKYNVQCDMWSVGVITYIMLCGYPPFYGDNNKEIFKKILTCDYKFYEDEWKHISKEAVHFVRKLIIVDTEVRMSAEEALKHPWLKTGDSEPRYLCPSVLKRLRIHQDGQLRQKLRFFFV